MPLAREIALTCEADIATFQILSQMLRHLEASRGLRWTATTGGVFGKFRLEPETFPFIVRSCDLEALRLARTLHRNGVAYGFYLDDNFWLLDKATPLGLHYRSAPIQQQLNWIVRHAHVVVAATPLLGSYLSRLNSNVVVLGPHMDLGLVPRLEPVSRRKRVRGGFAGSLYRGADLAHVGDAILAVLERHDDFEFELIGPDNVLPDHPRITAFPYKETYADYVSFQRSRRWDFALAPLGAAESNLYKTDNKFREYAAHGVPGIYEDAPPYAHLIDGVTGLLVGEKRTWDEAIELYVTDRDLRMQVRRSARDDVEQRYSLDVVADSWGAFFEAAPEAGTAARFEEARVAVDTPISRTASRWLRMRLLTTVAVIAIEEHGLRVALRDTLGFLRRRTAHTASIVRLRVRRSPTGTLVRITPRRVARRVRRLMRQGRAHER